MRDGSAKISSKVNIFFQMCKNYAKIRKKYACGCPS